MPNRFSVVLRTRSFKIVGFEDLIVCFLIMQRQLSIGGTSKNKIKGTSRKKVLPQYKRQKKGFAASEMTKSCLTT